MRRIICTLAGLFLLPITLNVGAESLTSKAFEYKGGKIDSLEHNELYAAWLPTDPALTNKPGLKVLFFGRPDGCALLASNGPVTNQGNRRFKQALELTGIPLDDSSKGHQWSPSADYEQCDASTRHEVADSFVHINSTNNNGGIGLFTFTGPDQTGHTSFFKQYSHTGKAGVGANPNIIGTFTTFRFDWKDANTPQPFGGQVDTPVPQRAMLINTVQGAPESSVGSNVKKIDKISGPVQAKQQVIVALTIPACMQAPKKEGVLCQVQYLWNTALFQNDVDHWDANAMTKAGGAFFDKGQKGMPVVRGFVGRNGQATFDKASHLKLFTSLGEPTSNDRFDHRRFVIQVTFGDLVNALKIIAASATGKSVELVSDADLTKIFGDAWHDPNAWRISSISVGQEVHNPKDNVRAFIGGNIKELYVGQNHATK